MLLHCPTTYVHASVLWKSHFVQIPRLNLLNIPNIRLIESGNLTQNGFLSLRLLFSGSLLEKSLQHWINDGLMALYL